MPPGVPLERRLLTLLARMPALQKIGQILARDPELDPALRAQLTRLESSVQDITPAEVRAEVERQLGTQLERYGIELQETVLAEASVSAVVRFTWHSPTNWQREHGVLKVLKPYVPDYYPEELRLLRGLADFVDANQGKYELPTGIFRKVMEEVTCLLSREVDLPSEQAALADASLRYSEMTGVRVPRLIRELCTTRITAMSGETGVKVTDAFRAAPSRRARLAKRVIEALIAAPLYAEGEEAYFHADLHAGNMIVDEPTDTLTILDWALVVRLSRAQRRHLVLLTLAVAWRDIRRTYEAIAALCRDDLEHNPRKAAIVRGKVAEFFENLSPFRLPDVSQIAALMDGISLLGVHFPAELLLLRKTLYTLNGVIAEISPNVRIGSVIARYGLGLLLRESPGRQLRLPIDTSTVFRSHLSNYDLTLLALSLPLLGGRLYMRTLEDVTTQAFAMLEGLIQGRTFDRRLLERIKWPRITIQDREPGKRRTGSTSAEGLLRPR